MIEEKTKITIQNADIGFRIKKGSVRLLQDINISAEKGELIALIGVNGSGKSTLLRTVIGLQELLSGTIMIDDKNHSHYSKIEFAKEIAFVSSEIIQTKYLKVKDLVALGRYPHQTFSNQNSEKDKAIIDSVLKTVGMGNFKERLIAEISDGERQKIMTARALAQETDIILLDEPAAFLDLANKFSLYKILSDTCRNLKKTIIFSTHDLNIALKYCDKVWLIKDTKIYEGSPEDLFLSGMLQNIFSDKHVFFNPDTFEYSVKLNQKVPINIIKRSQSDKLKMLILNALQRKGFYESDSEISKSLEIINNKTFIIKNHGNHFETKSIYELLKILTEMN